MQNIIPINDKASKNNLGIRKAILITIALVVILLVLSVLGLSSRSEAYEKGRNLGIGMASVTTERGNRFLTGGTKLKFTNDGQQLAEASGYKRGSKEANEFCDGFDDGWQAWLNHVRR